MYKLSRQIAEVYRYLPEYSSATEAELKEKAENVTFEFLGRIPKIREYIETDVQAAYDGDPAAYSKDEIIYSYPGLFAILINRIAHELYNLGVPIIPRMMTEYAHSETGIDIHPGATIGKYFFIDHGTGIVIGETTIIGDNVKIYQGVTLGALSTRGGGDTVIGKDVVIGGNAFITRSVPDGAKVSVKNQELRYNYDASKPVERVEIEEDDSWFYII